MENNYVLSALMEDIGNAHGAKRINDLWLKGYLTITEAKKMLLDAYEDSKHHFMIMYKENKPGKRYKALSDTVYTTRKEAQDAIPNTMEYLFKLRAIPAGNTVTLSTTNH